MTQNVDQRPDPADPLADSPVFEDLTDDTGHSLAWHDEDGLLDQEEAEESFDDQELIDDRLAERRARRRQLREARHSPAGKLLTPAGLFVLTLGTAATAAGIAAPDAVGSALDTARQVGLTPFTIVAIGFACFGLGLVRKQVAQHEHGVQTTLVDLQNRLDGLGAPNDDDEAVVERLDRVLVSLERQLEKINNLTRATKMYGKPLVDISKQISDLGNQLGDVCELPQKLESMEDPEQEERIHDLSRIARGTQAAVRELHEELGPNLANRIDSLAAQVAAQAVEGAAVDTTEFTEGLDGVRRELQALSTAIARVDSRVGRAAAAAPTAAPATAPAAPTPQAATSESTGAPAASSGPDQSGLASKIAGSRPAGGKGVLSAIEKLKSMRG